MFKKTALLLSLAFLFGYMIKLYASFYVLGWFPFIILLGFFSWACYRILFEEVKWRRSRIFLLKNKNQLLYFSIALAGGAAAGFIAYSKTNDFGALSLFFAIISAVIIFFYWLYIFSTQ